MTSVSYHDTVNVLQDFALASVSPFERREWFELLSREGGLSPLIAVAQDGSDVIALPMMRQDGVLVPLANWYSFMWMPLASEGAALPEMLAAIATDLRSQSGRVTLWPVPEDGGCAQTIATAFRQSGWVVFTQTCDLNHVLRINGRDYAAYLASRPGPLRTTLKRKSKHLDVSIDCTFDDQSWRDYETIYNASWKPSEGRPAMLRRFAEQEGSAGRLRLAIARHEGEAVAAQFWTVESGTAFIHKLAHLEESKQLSAGTVLTAALMEQVIDRDCVDLVDFGTGDDPYKGVWMEETRKRCRIECFRPGNPGNWPLIAKAAIHKLASRRRAG